MTMATPMQMTMECIMTQKETAANIMTVEARGNQGMDNNPTRMEMILT